MSQLVKFGDVVLKVNDKVDPQEAGLERYVAGEHMVTDDPFLREFGLVGDGYLGPAFQMRFKPGHILYGSRRTYLRKVAMSSFEGVCANTTFVLRPVNDKLAKEFLLHVMSSERFHAHSILQSKGSVNPYINFTDLVDYEFELPSLDEQARIVELMTAVDEHLDALRNQLEIAKSSRAAVLHQLLSAGGDDWVNTTLGDILSFVSTRVMPENVSSNTPYVGLEHVDPKTPLISRWGEVASVSSSVTPFEPEDVLFGRLRPYLHKVSVADFPGVCTPEILVLRSSAMCRSRFLHLLCSLNSTINACIEMSAGTRMPRTSTTDLAKIQVQLPTIVEQERIVEIVSSMDDVIQATEQAIAEAKVLRTTLLNQEIS